MNVTPIHSAEFDEGYRITRAGDSLFIQATDDRAGPLRLRGRELASFGVRLAGDEWVFDRAVCREGARPADALWRFGIVALILALGMILLCHILASGR
jgi:hypothetical protein